MSLDKAIEHGKEHRKIYHGSKAIDHTCRNHGGCEWCKENRLHKHRKKILSKKQEEEEEMSNSYISKDILATDVVEVVRCRKCYFRDFDDAGVPVCTGAMAYSYTPDDWFCAAGKPKDGGQNE